MLRTLSLSVVAACLITLAGCASTVDAPVTATPPPAPSAPAAVVHGQPARIVIPDLAVDDNIVPVGLEPDGALEVPDVSEVGWYRGSPAPGNVGPSLVSGHVNWDGVSGSLAHIGTLDVGDDVVITDAAGVTATFDVYQVDQLGKVTIDWRQILADRPGPELVLVTCSGAVVDHEYLDNTIVRARLAA